MQWSTDTDCSVATLLNFFDLVNTKEISKVEAIWPVMLALFCEFPDECVSFNCIIECFIKRLVLPYAAICGCSVFGNMSNVNTLLLKCSFSYSIPDILHLKIMINSFKIMTCKL